MKKDMKAGTMKTLALNGNCSWISYKLLLIVYFYLKVMALIQEIF